MPSDTVAALWAERVSRFESDEEFLDLYRRAPAGLGPKGWLDLASMYVALHDIGQADWADCIDKAVLLCCRSMWLVGRKAEFRWNKGSRRYRWDDFLERSGGYRDLPSKLRRNRIRGAAHTTSAYVPTSQKHNFQYFRTNGSLTTESIYNWNRYRSAKAPFGVGGTPGVLDAAPGLARDPWELDLRPGDVLVFDLRWHGAGGYSGHVPTVAYFDAEAGLLGVVEDHLPRKDAMGKSPSESDAFLFSRDGQWDYVPGFNPKGGKNRFRGAGRFGASGIFHYPQDPTEPFAYDTQAGAVVAQSDAASGDARYMGSNFTGFVGFARYACRA